MAISDGQFRLGVIVGGIALAVGLATMRFCGSAALPPKPAPPPSGTIETATATQNELMSSTAGTPAIYRDLVAQDAQAAGLRTPTIAELGKKLAYRVDEARHVLELGRPPMQLAGLEIAVVRMGESIGLDIRNTTAFELAYLVVSAPTPNVAGCSAARPQPFNAMVIEKRDHETRVECVFRDAMAIAITRVETLELSPLSAWYLNHVPPELVGVEARIARGHRSPNHRDMCTPMLGQAVRSAIENGQIGWRDLVDFYARHRCQTYSIPLSYRAFTSDGQRSLPVTATER